MTNNNNYYEIEWVVNDDGTRRLFLHKNGQVVHGQFFVRKMTDEEYGYYLRRALKTAETYNYEAQVFNINKLLEILGL